MVRLMGVLLVLGWLLSGCVENYPLPESTLNQYLLVVDGAVRLETGTAQVRLTRTQNLAAATTPADLEIGATVTIEAEDSKKYRLLETAAGLYTASNLPLGYGRQYRLHISTQNKKEYLSEFVSAEKTPAIKELSWHVERGGVQVEVSTAGTPAGSRFYRWDFTETYQYETMLISSFKFDENVISRRKPSEFIFRCYKSESSRNILLSTTKQLTDNVVNHFPVSFRAGHEDHFTKLYSILVRQYAISQQEFDYWQMMKKNTESVGSLFDAQPSFITGNLTCITNPEEAVFGYFSAHSITEKRLFISADELRSYHFGSEGIVCETSEVHESRIPAIMREAKIVIIDSVVSEPPGPPKIGVYTVASNICGDCRLKGGTTLKPDFWP